VIEIPKHALTLEPYQDGKSISELAREKNLSRIVTLASNENPHGPSPMAMAAVRNETSELHRYCDPHSTELVEAIAERYGRKPSQIICTHGTDALLGYAISTFTSEQDEVLTSDGTFVGIYVNTLRLARKLRLVPLKEYAVDLNALASSISADTRIVYIANPNNPTGMMFGADEFEAFMSRVPESVLVILDEAYHAYAAEHDGYPDGLHYHYENLIVARSFSKVYGLAGLRIGFAVGSERLISALYKVKLPFEPNRLAQVAAMAALDDDEFLFRTLDCNRRSLALLTTCFDDLDIRYIKSVANFALMLLPTEEHAERFFDGCIDNGLVVRPVKPFGVANGIRISSGTEDETAFAVDVIKKVWKDVAEPTTASTHDKRF
jgi:histidinol-phosphate aminotransferase